MAASKNDVPLWAICTIEDVYASSGTYLLRLPSGTIVPAISLISTSGMPMGAREINEYMPKSRVLVLFDDKFDYPIIIGAAPKATGDFDLLIPNSNVLRSRVGFVEDPMHNSEMVDPKSFIADHGSGKPIDTLPGDWGCMNDLGVGFYIGRLMASIKSSDLAKVETFWGDDLLRLVGYNYELFTAGLEDKRINDEGEYNEIIRRTPYPWEGMGINRNGTDPTEEVDGKLEPGSEEARFEPKEKDQLIIPRQTILRGYLGDVEREIISVPPDSLETETFDANTIHQGVMEIIKSSDGTYVVRSAKGIILEKYSLIPVPKELKAPEDPEGDSRADGYTAAGIEGVNVPEFTWGDDEAPDCRASQLFDYLAYTVSKYTTAGLVKHEKDWYYPEENELDGPVNGSVFNTGYSDLENNFSLDLPAHGELKIDHRTGRDQIRYYQSRSCIAQLDDGSIIIEDGYGSQIAMKGGHIFLSCPGDVWAQPGRNFVAWAPYDAIIKAGNSAEVSASKKDVRIKAEKNLHMLAGNSGDVGGVLIETRSQGDSEATDFDESGERVASHGITFKAADSSIHAFGKNMHLGLIKDSNSGGKLTLDAGDGNMLLQATDILSNIKGLFAVMSEEDQRLLAINQNAAVISTQLEIGGNTIIAPADGSGSASLVVGGNLVVHEVGLFDGVVVSNTGFAEFGSGGPVAPLNQKQDLGQTKEQLGDNIKSQVQEVNDRITQALEEAQDNSDTSPGNSSFQSKIGFSFRDSEQDLGLSQDTFVLFETRWQQIDRLAGGGDKTWDEPEVKAPNGDVTLPYPGRQAWQEWSVFKQVQLNNFDMNAGKAKTRDEQSETGATPGGHTLENYNVVKKSS